MAHGLLPAAMLSTPSVELGGQDNTEGKEAAKLRVSNQIHEA